MKKRCSLYFAVVMLLLSLTVACTAESQSLIPFIEENDDINFDGYQFTFLQENDTDECYMVFQQNTAESDAMIKRVDEIEDKYNITINRVFNGLWNEDWSNKIIASILASSCDYDLMYRQINNKMFFVGKAGCLYPLTDFPDIIDLDDENNKYGTVGVLEACMFDGKPYAVQPTLWPGFQGCECFVIAYNKQLMQQGGMTDLHEYYENGTWTWEQFTSVMDEGMTAIPEEDTLFSAYPDFFLEMIWFSNGITYLKYEDGSFKTDILSPEMIQSVEFYDKFVSDYADRIALTGRWDISEFVNGSNLMTFAQPQNVITGDIAYKTDFDYGIMPFPCGSSGEYGNWAQFVSRVFGFSIPITNQYPEIAAYVIKDLFEPFDEFGGSYEGLIDYYRNYVFPTETDADIYFAIDRFARYDYDDVGATEFAGAIADTTGSSVQQRLEKYAPTIETVIEKYMMPNIENYIYERLYADNGQNE